MNILIVGAGSIGKRHLKNVLAHKEGLVPSVVEPNPERQKEVEALGVNPANIFKSREDALNGKTYDGVIIATPTVFHYDDAIAIAKAGIPLMIEKPLGADASRAAELKKAVQDKGIFSFTAYCFRFDPVANEFAKMLNEGKIGKPLYARAEMSTFLPEWHPHEDYRDFYMSKKHLGGGTLLDQSHLYDMTQWFFGDFESVFGITKKHSYLEMDTDDFGEFLFNMKSGINVSVHIDLFTRNWREFFQVTGETGTLTWDIHTRKIILENEKKEKTILMEGIDYNQMYINELDYFVRQLRSGGKESGPVYDHGQRVVEVIDAIRKSSDEGKVIKV